MRFYLDEDLSDKIALIARRLGADVISSHEVGNNGKSDEAQLEFAVAHHRCILTNNRDHFIALATQYGEAERLHAGILLLTRSLRADDFAGIAHAPVRYARGHSEDVIHHIDWLQQAAPE